MKVEVQYRWLLLVLSGGVLYLLRHHKIALAIYVGLVISTVLLYIFWLPRRVATQEKRFSRDALKHLTQGDLAGLDALARRQWLIRRFGRRHLIPDTLAMAASASGEHALARGFFAEALRHAPAEDKLRIELNLAGAEERVGALDSAEGRLRAILARRANLGPAQAALGRILVKKGESLREAARLLEAAAEACDPRELKNVHLARAQALLRTDQDATSALEAASAAGASEEELDGVRRSNSQSATLG